MQRFHVKKGDDVVVIAGTEKGKHGKILEVQPAKQRVIVEGLKMIKRHMKKGRSVETQQQGAIIEREGTIHISNVMLKADYDARAAKRGAAAGAGQA
ncbi:MAG: 50S ribosomal protein L24 [Verrucomicrobia bacterium]|nr:50S ribosomal protein L24 [Verrucomicrobiota bacterium]